MQYCQALETKREVVVFSTASPYKFSRAVYQSITGKSIPDDLDCMTRLYELTKMEIPAPLEALSRLEVRFKEVVALENAKQVLLDKLEKHDA